MSPEHVHKIHPRLFHYTNFDGLRGILESQTLWASDSKTLNDHTEIFHMRSKLKEIAYRIVNDIIKQKNAPSFDFQRKMKALGGLHAASLEEAKRIVSLFYDLTFNGLEDQEPYARPFITSFCAHTQSSAYVKSNGLLSQWRGYGCDGGFALVFNTEKLWNRLQKEANYYEYAPFNLCDVIYDNASAEIIEEAFQDLTNALNQFVKEQLFEGLKNVSSKDIFIPFFGAASRYKHRGFEEENEVRLVVSPTPRHVIARAVKQGQISTEIAENAKIKPILKHDSGNEYLELNRVEKQKHLPIERIIIGPQADQDQAEKKVRKILDKLGLKKIRLTKSETPYLPPKYEGFGDRGPLR